MSIESTLEMLRVGSGRPGVPRWLAGADGAVLLSGQTVMPRGQYRHQLTTSVLMQTGGAEAALTALAPLRGADPLPAGLLEQPEWDIARDGDRLCRIVEQFGGGASRLVLYELGQPAQVIDHVREGISLGSPRFRRGASGSPLALITAIDRNAGQMWRLSGTDIAALSPLGQGLRALALETAEGDILLSISPRRGGLSPLGDRAGQLHVAQLGKDSNPNGHRPLKGAETHQVYDFDAATGPDGKLHILAATRRGLQLFTGSPAGLAAPVAVTRTPVLHPALMVDGDRIHMAHNRIENGVASETMVATLPRAALPNGGR